MVDKLESNYKVHVASEPEERKKSRKPNYCLKKGKTVTIIE